MVLLYISSKFREKIDNFINKTVGAAKIRHLVMGRSAYDISECKVARAKELVTCAEVKLKFLFGENNLRRLIGRSAP